MSAGAVVVDLGFGDSGKGTFVDYLARRRQSDLVVRFNGGPQAAHTVVLPDGRFHVFAQFGAGTFSPRVRTLLSHYAFIEPCALLNEEAHLRAVGATDALARLSIDERCVMITPMHRAANVLHEAARGDARHGTCGIGFGACVADTIAHPDDAIRAADLRDRAWLVRKLRACFERWRSELLPVRCTSTHPMLRVVDDPGWIEVLADAAQYVARTARIVDRAEVDGLIRESHAPLFEGAQGVLLDEDFGFHPHTTWSRTTFANAEALIKDANVARRVERIGVLRTYLTRHGSGPFPSEQPELRYRLPEPHNSDAGAQGRFRRGLMDLVLARYALQCCGGTDAIALSHIDRVGELPPFVVSAYHDASGDLDQIPRVDPTDFVERTALTQRLSSIHARSAPISTDNTSRFVSALERELSVPVKYLSAGPTYTDKSER